MTTNLNAFMDMIACSEGTSTIPSSDNGYNVLVGSTPQNPIFFYSYDTHPDIYNPKFNSTAAGRYQIIHPTFISLCKQHGYTDFTPPTQDLMATDLISGAGAMEDVIMGRFSYAVQKCANIWASLPGGDSGQHENALWELQQVYVARGGVLADADQQS